MDEQLAQVLSLVWLTDGRRPCAVLAQAALARWRAVLPAGCRVEAAPDAAYLDTLQRILPEAQPDRLLLVPPVTAHAELPARVRASHPQLGLHEIALAVALEAAPAGCRLGVWLPRGFFVNPESVPLRRRLNAEAPPHFLLEYWNWPAGGNGEGETPLQLLVVEAGGGEGGRLVRFFRFPAVPPLVSADGQRQPDIRSLNAVIDDLQRLLKRDGGPTEHGFVAREGLDPATSWLFERHHPNYQRVLADLGRLGSVATLGELAELFFGFRSSEQVNFLLPASARDAGLRVLEGQHIRPDGTLDLSVVNFHVLPDQTSDYELQANDICLRSELDPQGRLVAACLSADLLPLAANQSVLVLRPRPGKNVDGDFLAAYLRSNHAVGILKAQGIARRLYPAALNELAVPMQDELVAATLADLRRAAESLGAWRHEAESALGSLFDHQTLGQAREQLLEAGRRVRQRERVARQVDEVSYRLRAGLPYPLAYRWRVAETAAVSLEGYKDTLASAEMVITCLALMTLAAARAAGESIRYVDGLRERLSDASRAQGTSLGDWVAILREFGSEGRAKRLAGTFLGQMARALRGEPVDAALTTIAGKRNDEAHLRGPSRAEIETHLEETRSALQQLLEAFEFLTEYPLHYIESTRRDSISGKTHYTYRSLMGDHALVAPQEGRSDSTELEAGSLYLVGRMGEQYLLRPFLTRCLCLECGQMEIFFLDKYQHSKRNCRLKSLEQAHELEEAAIVEPLRHVGLLG